MIVKARQLKGLDAAYIPGWDCHGLPIEHQIEKKHGRNLDPNKARQLCRAYAGEQIERQKGHAEVVQAHCGGQLCRFHGSLGDLVHVRDASVGVQREEALPHAVGDRAQMVACRAQRAVEIQRSERALPPLPRSIVQRPICVVALGM